MKRYQYVDEFIAEVLSGIGDTFYRRQFADWLDGYGFTVNPGTCLDAHRKSPERRAFTTERVGMGPRSYYRVVESAVRIEPKSVARMNAQQGREMVARWMKEYQYRMYPLAKRDKRARRILLEAQAQVAAIATLVGVQMDGIFGDED